LGLTDTFGLKLALWVTTSRGHSYDAAGLCTCIFHTYLRKVANGVFDPGATTAPISYARDAVHCYPGFDACGSHVEKQPLLNIRDF
jgi:hypothetical protein